MYPVLGSYRERGDHGPFNDRVRIVLKNQAVFAGAGFAFIAIAQNVFRFARLLGNERPFQPRAESSAATAAQAGVLDFIDDGVGLHGQRFLHSLIAIELNVAVDVRRALAKALGNDFYLVGMGNQSPPFNVLSFDSFPGPRPSCVRPNFRGNRN